MSSIRVNGKTYNIPSGKSVSIINGAVYVDGKALSDGPDMSGIAVIKWDGEIASLTTDLSVNCENVSGNVSAGGSVNCDHVQGSVYAEGSVNCGRVAGDVKAGGSVNHS